MVPAACGFTNGPWVGKEQQYEVSTHGLFNLTKDDYIEWKLFCPAVAPTIALNTNNIKMNLFNLQQIGLH